MSDLSLTLVNRVEVAAARGVRRVMLQAAAVLVEQPSGELGFVRAVESRHAALERVDRGLRGGDARRALFARRQRRRRVSPRARMTKGSVMPLTSRVITMTLAASRMMSSRPGNGAPLAVVSGIDSAAASVNDPRMPAHAVRNTRSMRGKPSRLRMRLISSGGRYAPKNTQTMRSASRAAESASAYPSTDSAPARSTSPDQRMQLHAKQDENEPIEREQQHGPHFPRMRARRRIDVPRIVGSGVQAGGNDRQDAAHSRRLGSQVGGVRRQQRQHGLDGRIGDAVALERAANASDHPRDRDTEREAAGGQQEELQRCFAQLENRRWPPRRRRI